jgi:HEAT repeat protein
MLAPPPLPRTLDAALRDATSARAETRASALADLVRHAQGRGLQDAVRARTVSLALAALQGDESAGVRSAAAVALGDLGAADALPALLLAIEDDDVHVRQMALNALGEIGDARAVPRLSRALADARPEVRYQAVIAYAKLAADAADVDAALVRACADADDAVRYIALRVAEERIEGVARHAPCAALLTEARARLATDVPHVALAAAILLAKAGGEGADLARGRILAVVSGGPGPRVEKEDEREAVELAGALDLRAAVPHLERRAWGLASHLRDTCAWHAKIALARMGHPRASAEILRDLDSSRAETRSAAVVAAGRARLRQARAKIASLAGDVADPQLVADALAQLDGAPRAPRASEA